MKKFCILCACVALAGFASCQKQQTEEEKKAEIDRQVRERLGAEHQAEEQQKLTQREAELAAREKTLAEKQNTAAQTPTPRPRPARDSSANEPAASYNTFYTKLERYGDWRETSDYGYVWQPREAEQSRNWRPYTSGRWVYTDAGWTWVSEEPFGWATYHYGRWTRLRNIGWVWVPGDEWAPAWVSWRKSNDYVGWAPLPPEARFDRRTGIHNWSDNYYDIGPDQYSFVPTNEFGARRVEGTVVSSERNVTIISQTTNVTNITYNNSTVVNQGPNYDELRTRTHQPIERLRLEREVNVDLNVEAPRLVVRGEVLVIPAPLIARGQPVERPKTVKEAIATVVVDRGWEAITDRPAAEKARAKMKSEATPPSDAPPKTFVKPATVAASQTTTAPSATATATPTPPARVQRKETPAPSATPSPAEVPSASPAATSERKARSVPTSSPSISPGASPTASPLATATISPPPHFRATPEPAGTMTPRGRPTPAAVIIPPPASPNVSPKSEEGSEERPRVGGKFKSQARRFNPDKILPMPGAMPTSPISSPGASPASSPTARSATTPPLMPNVSVTPSSAADASSSPSPKQEEQKHKREGEKPAAAGASVSPTPRPTPTPEAE